MDSQLYIPDGPSPNWWESPAIFVTAADAPSALSPAVIPVVGQPCSVWAQVFNTGSMPVQEPRVNFYSAPGSADIAIFGSTQIGSGQSIALAPGASTFIQCMENWDPTGSGHFCLIAIAYDNSDQSELHVILDTGQFNAQTHTEVAQKNLTVLPGVGMHHVGVTVSGLRAIDKEVVLEAYAGGVLGPMALNRLGLPGLKPGRAEQVEVSLDHEPPKSAEQSPSGIRSLPIKVQRGTSRLVHASIGAPKLGAGEYQVVRVVERIGGRILGGVSYVVVADLKPR